MYRVQYMPEGTLSGIARYYKNPNAGALEDYGNLCMLNWNPANPDREVWVHGLMGKLGYREGREFIEKLADMGFENVRALRKEGHILPRAKEHPDGNGLVIRLSDLQRPSAFGDLA